MWIGDAGSQLGLPEDRILNGVLIASAGQLLMFPIFGWLSDRVGRRPMYMTGAVVVGLMFSVQATFFSELFGVRVRYSGVSLAYQLGGVLGGFVPFIATALLAAGGASRGWSPPSWPPWLSSPSRARTC